MSASRLLKLHRRGMERGFSISLSRDSEWDLQYMAWSRECEEHALRMLSKLRVPAETLKDVARAAMTQPAWVEWVAAREQGDALMRLVGRVRRDVFGERP